MDSEKRNPYKNDRANSSVENDRGSRPPLSIKDLGQYVLKPAERHNSKENIERN